MTCYGIQCVWGLKKEEKERTDLILPGSCFVVPEDWKWSKFSERFEFLAWENCTLKQRKKTLKGTRRYNFSVHFTSVDQEIFCKKRFEKEKVTRDETWNSRFWDLNFKIKKTISIVSHPISNEIKSLSILLQFFNYSSPKSANLIVVWSYITYISMYISKYISIYI